MCWPLARGARIWAEVGGSGVNCGGHRMGGSMTAPNPESVRRCIQLAMDDAGITADQVDAINAPAFTHPVDDVAQAMGGIGRAHEGGIVRRGLIHFSGAR